MYHHHERWDGTGYPLGLAGEAIPLGARIFAVADALDAMTFDRPYSRAITLEAAREEIHRCAGTHFDPAVVATFLAMPLGALDAIRRGGGDGVSGATDRATAALLAIPSLARVLSLVPSDAAVPTTAPGARAFTSD